MDFFAALVLGLRIDAAPHGHRLHRLSAGDRGAITASIAAGRMGRCPAWVDKLDAATIKSLAVYIWRKVQG